jgi:hypothetical protein
MPPVVTTIPTIGDAASGMLAFGTQSGGGAQYLITNFPPNTSVTPNVPPTTSIFDLTTSPPTIGATLIQNGGTQSMALGPDGCVYTAGGNTIWRLTDSTGACSYTASTPAASLALTPVALESNPAQGTSQTFVANFHFVAVPAGTPILFNVSGANTEFKSINSDSNGQATFTYTGGQPGCGHHHGFGHGERFTSVFQSGGHHLGAWTGCNLPDPQPEPTQCNPGADGYCDRIVERRVATSCNGAFRSDDQLHAGKQQLPGDHEFEWYRIVQPDAEYRRDPDAKRKLCGHRAVRRLECVDRLQRDGANPGA